MQSIEAKLMAGVDPDEWVILIVQLENALGGMQQDDVRELLTQARAGSKTAASTVVMPVLYVAVSRAASGNVLGLLSDEIQRAASASLWGLTIALAVERPEALVEHSQREFWTAAFLHRPFGRDPHYWKRYLAKRGIISRESATQNLAMEKSLWRHVSPAPFLRTVGTVSPEVLGILLDRLEKVPRAELEEALSIVGCLPSEAQDVQIRTDGWILDPELHPELRWFALRVLGSADLDKATMLARTAIQRDPNDPTPTLWFASWLLSKAPRQGVELLS